MRLYGLIGWPLGHSFSERYFTEKFERLGLSGECAYRLFPLENIEMLPVLLEKQPDLLGLNVTVPFKKSVIPFLDELDETAFAVGAVNTIRIRDGKLMGFNTDVIGFEKSLDERFPQIELSGGCLILGTGGAAQAVAHVLSKKGMPFKFVSRKKTSSDTLLYSELDEKTTSAAILIVNTTPLGMAPAIDGCPPIPFEFLKKETLVFDLIYNPAETIFLRRAAARGCPTRNGLDMLYRQADAAWDIFK